MDNDLSEELESALSTTMKTAIRGAILIDAIITEVDEVNYVCTVNIRGAILYNVPLKVLIGTKPSIIGIPTIGTTCLVTFRDGNTHCPQIFSVQQYDKLFITCDDMELNGLLLKYNNLNITAMLNVITGTPINEPGNGSPSALQQALSTALNT